MKRAEAILFSAYLGRRLRAIREQQGKFQDEGATVARGFGFRWSRATVAALETGRRHLSVEEFLLLPSVLSVKRKVELSGLFAHDAWIVISSDATV